MRIIFKGIKPEDREYVMNCRNCGTVFSILASEGIKTTVTKNVGLIMHDCPTCDMLCSKSVNDRQRPKAAIGFPRL